MSAPAVATAPDPGPALPFPSVEWFQALAARSVADQAAWRKLGTVDCVAEFVVLDAPGGPARIQVTFDEFDIPDIRAVGPEAAERADFSLEASLATWREMIENIQANNGRPDLSHSLNYLSLPGVPIYVRQDDPVRKDCFYRFNQSLQVFVNQCGQVATRFPA